ncbi:hypothetical protein FNO01nite_30820 [Flavobacterium noncentrifugens]|uniref:DUF4920 domain-containing protein n=1 Tax=Flavobacterium noncentrifugens TaxID=1128970 RepID=A0A1G9BY94_9FLAO|nr:DUF4920 domain-containing protein [Flavobacterium noncentrifugens]GEP52410.1 hypothetical protein FNO01nite_30820 [Flavobacterium noncentrifugens]SDK44418.1 protein of unknown function [Flavobacterium noncentrifugens]
MKKIIVLGCSLLALASCKNKSEEVKIDETKVETPVDTIVQKDTVAILETAVQETKETPVAEKPIGDKTIPAKMLTPKPAIIKVQNAKKMEVSYSSFGDKILADKALTQEEMLNKYNNLKAGDTIAVKFKSKITAVCKKKGCWMKMDLAHKKESFVRFKDYGFFVPVDADNSEAIISGRAYVEEISVAEQKHYAKDGGKSQEEIDKITTPKVTYAFEANGVLIQQ